MAWKAFLFLKNAWRESMAKRICASRVLRDSLALRLAIRPYKLLVTVLRFFLLKGLPGIFKILLMK